MLCFLLPRRQECRRDLTEVSPDHSKKLEGRIWSNPLGKSDIESTDCTVTSGINNDAAASTASTTVPANAASARVPCVKGWRFMMDPVSKRGGSPNELPSQPQWLLERISAKHAPSVCQTSAISRVVFGMLLLVACVLPRAAQLAAHRVAWDRPQATPQANLMRTTPSLRHRSESGGSKHLKRQDLDSFVFLNACCELFPRG